MTITRRPFILGLSAAALTFAGRAFAGSYMDRAHLLIDGSRRDCERLRAKLTDKELCQVILTVAKARVDAASAMFVPEKVGKAHPHLLLSLTAAERAAEHATHENYALTLEALDVRAREEGIFRDALREIGFPLPASVGP